MPIKVLSLVPAEASDIRDSSEASLGTVAQLRTRARTFEAVAIGLAILAAGMLIVALVPFARRPRSADAAAPRRVTDREVLRAAAAALSDAQSRAARDGWSDDTLSAAMAPMRIIAATVIEHRLSEKVVGDRRDGHEGRLLVRSGWVRPTTIAVSSGVTSGDVARAGTVRDLTPLRDALDTFTAAAYRRTPHRDAVTLDAAARAVVDIAQAVAGERRWRNTRRPNTARA